MAKLEKIDNNKVKLTFEVSPEKFEEGLKQAYNKKKSNINIQGFRKGKAPRKIIEAQFGKEVFFEDAVNFVLPESYEKAVKEHDLEVVSMPEIDILEVSTEKGVVITAEVYLKPEATVDGYKGLAYKKLDDNISEDEINKEIDEARKQNARILTINDRPVQNEDLVTIDFDGSIDGIPFEGGKGENYELKVGSHTFIDNFEEQLIGANIGDTVNVNVTFPGEYGKEELAGKPALFVVNVKEIKFNELPVLDNDFAQDVSEFDTVEEYKNSIREKLQKNKEESAKNHKENAIMLELINLVKVDLPKPMVDSKIDQMVKEFENRMKSQGLNIETYLNYMGQTIEELKESYRDNAKNQVLARLGLEAVVANEKFLIDEVEFNEELERVAKLYGMEFTELEKVLREEDRKGMTEDLKMQKALKLLLDTAVELE